MDATFLKWWQMDREVSKLLTVKEAAERAGVSISLIYAWCDERRLPHYRIGMKNKRGKILISPSDLDSFMESLRVEASRRPLRG